MFFPYVTSWQLYTNYSCLKFEIYFRDDLLAVTDGTVFVYSHKITIIYHSELSLEVFSVFR